ncbi:MAG: four helix bundle protein [Patescibacteria group bacterium]
MVDLRGYNFEKLNIYQRSLSLVEEVYRLTKEWPKEYLFDLTSQFRRAALSIPLNVAEGSGRAGKEAARFAAIARGSVQECIPIIETSRRLGLIDGGVYQRLYDELTELSKMLSALQKRNLSSKL